ncbi:MAG: menaquinone biosynthesis protein [Phycisphaerales bacterium]|nr:menaquinone biosynthesis protein [Phycisphaerales bacterium]
MQKKIILGTYTYRNVAPLMYGIKSLNQMNGLVQLVESYPSDIAHLFKQQQLDIALMPVGYIRHLSNNYRIISDYCIGSREAVASVCLFSKVSLENITKVYLDYQSETSNQLIKILFHELWKKEVVFENINYDKDIHQLEQQAGILVIGDRALKKRLQMPFCVDLGLSWYQLTGLPFTWAVWVTALPISHDLTEELNKVFSAGLQHIDAIAQAHYLEDYDMRTYYTKNIYYNFDSLQKQGMERYIQYLQAQN